MKKKEAQKKKNSADFDHLFFAKCSIIYKII
jgi:hypothetical protein